MILGADRATGKSCLNEMHSRNSRGLTVNVDKLRMYKHTHTRARAINLPLNTYLQLDEHRFDFTGNTAMSVYSQKKFRHLLRALYSQLYFARRGYSERALTRSSRYYTAMRCLLLGKNPRNSRKSFRARAEGNPALRKIARCD